MRPVLRADQLRSDAEAVGGPAHATFENARDAERFRDLSNVDVPAFEGERRGARNHFQAGYLHQSVDDLFGEAVAEVLLFLVAAEVGEREDRDRRRRFFGFS